MNNLVILYTKEIQNGTITIEDVPNKLKDKVQAEIDNEIVGE